MPFQALQIVFEMWSRKNTEKINRKENVFFQIAKHIFFIFLHYDLSYFQTSQLFNVLFI
jgi:hypothetical protein